MNIQKARNILGLTGNESEKEIKKKYHKLMHKVHPDANTDDFDSSLATEINCAYDYVLKHCKNEEEKEREREHARSKRKENWNAKQNMNAYAERPIYHLVEDSEGNSIGTIKIARGKYVWTLEEEFPLFLKSILDTSKEILLGFEDKLKMDVDYVVKQKYLAELTYLLTYQFIDSLETLDKLSSLEDGAFKIEAMVEVADRDHLPKPGTMLFPAGIRDHKLYIKDKEGKLVGYLSFKDDRMYYILIPLFEQRQVMLKIMTKENSLKSKTRKPYVDTDLWVKYDRSKEKTAMESVELKIKNLLDEFCKLA